MSLFPLILSSLSISTFGYDFAAHGTVDLRRDYGWSQFGKACVGYLEVENFTSSGDPAGYLYLNLSIPASTAFSIEPILVMYDDQENSYPTVSDDTSGLSCHSKVYGNYKRLGDIITLEPGKLFSRIIKIHQHIQTRWWYFYLADCESPIDNLSYPMITYSYSYKDNADDTGTCKDPNATTATSTALMWALIGIILVVIIGLVIAFGMNYAKKKREEAVNTKENLLMESLNNETSEVLKKWGLSEYEDVLINEKGYDDIEQWKDLKIEDLDEMGFKEGHSRKFMKKVQEHFMDVMVETEIDKEQEQDEIQEEGVSFTNQ